GDDLRLHLSRRQRPLRPAGNQPRRAAGYRRHPASDPRHRQGQGHGNVPDRAPDGCPGSRTGRPGSQDLPGRPAAGRNPENRPGHRQQVAAERDDDQGMRQPRIRDQPGRRGALRASGIPFDLRYRRPDRGHAGFRREAPAELQAQLSGRALRAIRPEGGAPTEGCRSSAPAANGVQSTPTGTALSPTGRAPTAVCRSSAPAPDGVQSTPTGTALSPTGRAPTAVCRSSALAANGVQSTPTGTALSPTGRAPTAVCRSGAGTPDRPAANGVHSTPNRLTTTTRQPHENWLY